MTRVGLKATGDGTPIEQYRVPHSPVSTGAGSRIFPALFEVDGPAGALDLLLGLVGLLLGHLLQDRLGGRVHQVLGFLEPQIGKSPDLLDDLDLLVSSR